MRHMLAHPLRDLNAEPLRVRVEFGPAGEVEITLEVDLVGSRATRSAGRARISPAAAARLQELARGPYPEPVRCTAHALLAYHEGATLERAARVASRTGSWLWLVWIRVHSRGPDELLSYRFLPSPGKGLPHYPEGESG